MIIASTRKTIVKLSLMVSTSIVSWGVYPCHLLHSTAMFAAMHKNTRLLKILEFYM